MSFRKWMGLLPILLGMARAQGNESAAIELPEVTAYAPKPFTTASSRTVRDRDFALRVMLKPSDLIKVTPGLFTGQHAGGGKANQYFLRGFDIDHGTDLALWVDGMPVNNVSHGHGQGYADLRRLRHRGRGAHAHAGSVPGKLRGSVHGHVQ